MSSVEVNQEIAYQSHGSKEIPSPNFRKNSEMNGAKLNAGKFVAAAKGREHQEVAPAAGNQTKMIPAAQKNGIDFRLEEMLMDNPNQGKLNHLKPIPVVTKNAVPPIKARDQPPALQPCNKVQVGQPKADNCKNLTLDVTLFTTNEELARLTHMDPAA